MVASVRYAGNNNRLFLDTGMRRSCKSGVPIVPCLGDSITYGIRVEPKNAYPALLDARCASYAFANMGCPGGGSMAIRDHVREFIVERSLGAVHRFVLQVPMFDRRPDPDLPLDPTCNDYTFNKGITLARNGMVDAKTAMSLMEEEMVDLTSLLKHLDEVAARPTLVVVYPYRSHACPTIDALSDEWFARIVKVLEETERSYVLLSRKDVIDDPDIVFSGDIHLSDHGHNLLAEKVRRAMLGFDEL